MLFVKSKQKDHIPGRRSVKLIAFVANTLILYPPKKNRKTSCFCIKAKKHLVRKHVCSCVQKLLLRQNILPKSQGSSVRICTNEERGF